MLNYCFIAQFYAKLLFSRIQIEIIFKNGKPDDSVLGILSNGREMKTLIVVTAEATCI